VVALDLKSGDTWARDYRISSEAGIAVESGTAAAENQSALAEYMQQLVENYVEHDAWFRQQVNKGLLDQFVKSVGIPFDYMLEDFRSDESTSRYLKGARSKELQRR
jgi:hypothetical protein